MFPNLILGAVEIERERARGVLAVILLLLLGLASLAIFFLIWRVPQFNRDDVTTFITGVFTPLVALASGATGFYFGAKQPGGE